MLTERPIHVDLKNMLLNNEPFVYAHLIKFERPSRPDANGRVSTSRERYSYLTDASRNVDFNDGSSNLAGVANGTQTYLANKVLKVGNVVEQTEARASNYSLTLDGNGIGAYVEAFVTISQVNTSTWDLQFPASVDLLRAGFREGDKVTLGLARSGNFNILNFRENNTLRVGKVDDTLTAGAVSISMSLSSEEIKSILLDKNAPEYASFVNREVYIYRGYFQQGQIVGTPVLIFKGIISNVSFEETDANIQVTWGLTSHWGDFAQVKGRITSDGYHRALDQNGIPQPQSALKTSYAYDKGFTHSETSINLLATYSIQVEKQDIKYKNGFLGIGAKMKVKKYYVSEDRNTELDFQLQAKSIPVIYGVRNTPGTPVFADTLNNNSSIVYVAHVLSEGEIGGLYDAYVNGNSLICNDKADFDARSVQTADNTVELICRGRADRGDVLGGVSSLASPASAIDYYEGFEDYYTSTNYNYLTRSSFVPYVQPTITNTDSLGKGIIDGESIHLTSPQSITIDVFSGKPGQKASSQLVEIARANNFKIQNSYWGGADKAEYWGPNHRLLDTAYVVVKYVIAEGETTIPDIQFVVRGKALRCYNYDYSYSHYTKASAESAANFPLGSEVTLYDMNDVALSGSVQIIDKWTFMNPDGTFNTRFRFSEIPNLGYIDGVPAVKKFYMQNGASQRWTMVTFNYEEYNGTVGATLETPVTGVVNDGGYVAITYPPTPNFGTVSGDPVEGSTPFASLIMGTGSRYQNSDLFNSNRILNAFGWSQTQYTSRYPVDGAFEQAQEAVNSNSLNLVSRNTVVLSNDASAVDDYYNNYLITVFRYDPTTDKQYSQTKKVLDYVGATRTLTIDDIWDADIYPKQGDAVIIVPPYTDTRVSINPAIQSLDYITSPTYGRNLDPIKDLDLPSWLKSGRTCDTTSDVTVNHLNAAEPENGQIYRYPSTGNLIWQGKVLGTDGHFTEFTEVIGKLSNAWNSWKFYNINELVYVDSRLYRVTIAGTQPVKPTHTSGNLGGLIFISSLTLSSINGGPDLELFAEGNPVRASRNGTIIPGYSLYDCDEITYWRYLGWDEFNQRYVTRHQTNLIIDTSLPIFDNMNSLLEHFGGILRYSGGKYYLDVEEATDLISNSDNEVKNITSDHIIGKIRLVDEGTRSAFNSLTAAFADPANKFESKNISFFNSEFLKADRNVPKKGNLSIPGITNYYNTRILADKYLNKSRYGLTVSFNMAPRGLLLLSGMVIQLQHDRYGWEDKKFRITSLTHREDCTVDIVAEEYDDSFYVLNKLSRQAGSGLVGVSTTTPIGPPTDLRASNEYDGDEVYSGVRVTWTNNSAANTKNVYTELFSSFSSQLYVTVNSISGNTLTTTEPHELVAGELITSVITTNGLEQDKSYFVRSIVSPTQFTLSETKNGPVLGILDGTDIGAPMRTASLIATLPTPINSFVDSFGGIDERVSKFYWVRHKVVKG